MDFHNYLVMTVFAIVGLAALDIHFVLRKWQQAEEDRLERKAGTL